MESRILASTRVRIAYLKRMISRLERESARIHSALAEGKVDQTTAQVGLKGYDAYRRDLMAQLAELERSKP